MVKRRKKRILLKTDLDFATYGQLRASGKSPSESISMVGSLGKIRKYAKKRKKRR